MISEKRLKKMRKIALQTASYKETDNLDALASYVIQLTQEILDYRLSKKKKESQDV